MTNNQCPMGRGTRGGMGGVEGREGGRNGSRAGQGRGRGAWVGRHGTAWGACGGGRGLAVTEPPTTWRACTRAWASCHLLIRLNPVNPCPSLGELSRNPPLRGGLAGGRGLAVTEPPTAWGAWRKTARRAPHSERAGVAAGIRVASPLTRTSYGRTAPADSPRGSAGPAH
jgi:hypothetical protein